VGLRRTRSTPWRGCRIELDTSAAFPLLPARALPAELRGGERNTFIARDSLSSTPFFIVEANGSFFTHSGDGALTPTAEPTYLAEVIPHLEALTPGQALAAAEAFYGGGLAIDPTEPYYDQAVAWGEDWIEFNAFLPELAVDV